MKLGPSRPWVFLRECRFEWTPRDRQHREVPMRGPVQHLGVDQRQQHGLARCGVQVAQARRLGKCEAQAGHLAILGGNHRQSSSALPNDDRPCLIDSVPLIDRVDVTPTAANETSTGSGTACPSMSQHQALDHARCCRRTLAKSPSGLLTRAPPMRGLPEWPHRQPSACLHNRGWSSTRRAQ